MNIESFDIRSDSENIVINGEELEYLDPASSESPTGEFGGIKTVYIGRDFVVKIPGEGCSFEEAEFAPDASDWQYFARVVFVDINRRWYIQERVNCVPGAEFDGNGFCIVERLCDKYDITDVRPALIGTSHNCIPDINGIPKIYDYGSDDEI